MDVLSDVLRVIRLSGAVFFTGEFTSPWAINSPSPQILAPHIIPNAECFSIFHVLREGTCWVKVKGEPAIQMRPGDVLVIPRGDEHIMASDLAVAPAPMKELIPEVPYAGMPPVSHGGGGDVARFVCGYLHCDQRFDPLFSALPRLLCVRSHAGNVVVESTGRDSESPSAPMPFHKGMWLNTTLYYLIQEADAQKPGSESVLARLSETMFVEVLRQYMEKLSPDQKGWLAGLNDPQVGRALALLHAEPARSWTVDDLARGAGVSRSGLAERFTKLIGESPMSYLSSWRMHLARQLLSEGHMSAGEVATRVGYDSEYAFNRAFKRHVGQPPATWRKKTSPAATSAS
jgi:AraC-like DNA-binding protein